MANKLAGQRMKFTKARARYYQADHDTQRQEAAWKMAEVLADAPANGFAEADVTQGGDVPDEVRQLAKTGRAKPSNTREETDDRPAEVQLSDAVDTTDLIVRGTGAEAVYAYGYPCAPDRLKIGRTTGEVVTRVAHQIYTGTPDKPSLYLMIYTNDGAGLERVLHDVFRFQNKKSPGPARNGSGSAATRSFASMKACRPRASRTPRERRRRDCGRFAGDGARLPAFGEAGLALRSPAWPRTRTRGYAKPSMSCASPGRRWRRVRTTSLAIWVSRRWRSISRG